MDVAHDIHPQLGPELDLEPFADFFLGTENLVEGDVLLDGFAVRAGIEPDGGVLRHDLVVIRGYGGIDGCVDEGGESAHPLRNQRIEEGHRVEEGFVGCTELLWLQPKNSVNFVRPCKAIIHQVKFPTAQMRDFLATV